MDWQTAIDVLTAACAAYAAMGVHRLQRGHDFLAGKVQAAGEARGAHVNAAGLHGH